MKDFEKYSRDNIQFQSHTIPVLLQNIMNKFDTNDQTRILDIGCGDGVLLTSMSGCGFLHQKNAVGIDLSLTRLKRLQHLTCDCDLILGDASHLHFLKPDSFDLAICTQVIEHLVDENAFLSEMQSLLKPGSFLYLSTVIKGKNAFWIYRNNGHIVLDPTHIHEYESKDELIHLLRRHGFSPYEVQVIPVSFGVIECMIRVFILMGLHMDHADSFFIHHPRITCLNKLRIPVPGYSIIEGIFRRDG